MTTDDGTVLTAGGGNKMLWTVDLSQLVEDIKAARRPIEVLGDWFEERDAARAAAIRRLIAHVRDMMRDNQVLPATITLTLLGSKIVIPIEAIYKCPRHSTFLIQPATIPKCPPSSL